MKTLTKAEEQVMQYIWDLERAFLKDLVEAFPEPRPAYTTISTVIRVLVKKGFIGFDTFGKVHQYYPLVARNEYLKTEFDGVMSNYFNGSLARLASFFAEDDDIDLEELDAMRKVLEQKIQQRKTDNHE